jgi:predicted ArsR family transcriptional regulator
MDEANTAALADLAPLADPTRRRLCLYVIGQPSPVSREDAAAATGVTRALAAHHLDRLVEAGLLATEYRRLNGRSGPGAGRPSKLYRRTDREVSASVPSRHYDLAGELFAKSLSSSPAGTPGEEAAAEAGADYGRRLGQEVLRRAGSRSSARKRRAELEGVLREAGYAPFTRDGELRLLNCPFHELAQRHRGLTCGMNLALVRGILAGAGLPEGAARLDFQPGLCCVAIAGAASTAARAESARAESARTESPRADLAR